MLWLVVGEMGEFISFQPTDLHSDKTKIHLKYTQFGLILKALDPFSVLNCHYLNSQISQQSDKTFILVFSWYLSDGNASQLFSIRNLS